MDPSKDGEDEEDVEESESLERTTSGRIRRTEVQQLNGQILDQTLRPRRGRK